MNEDEHAIEHMSNQSREATIAQARAMGLELSSDGQSWVQIKPSRTYGVAGINDSHVPSKVGGKYDSKVAIFTPIGAFFIMVFIVGTLVGGVLGIVAFLALFPGLYFLSPFFFRRDRYKKEQKRPDVNGINSQEVISVKFPPTQNNNEKIAMRVFGAMSIVVILLAIVIILVFTAIFYFLMEVLSSMGGGGW